MYEPKYQFLSFVKLRTNMPQGRRYIVPIITDNKMSILIPAGEWRLDFILSKIINGSNTHIFTTSEYYTVKTTGAEEF